MDMISIPKLYYLVPATFIIIIVITYQPILLDPVSNKLGGKHIRQFDNLNVDLILGNINNYYYLGDAIWFLVVL